LRLARIDVVIAALAMIVTVLAVTWGVITRYVTAQPAAWASEVAAIAFAWLTFFGASACFRYRAHPSIDMLTALFPPRARRLVRRFNDLLVAAFLGYFAWLGAGFAIDALDNPTPVLRLPMTVVYGPVTLALLLALAWHLHAVLTGADDSDAAGPDRLP